MSEAKPESKAQIDYLIGQRVRQLRAAKGLSQAALAEKVGVTHQQVQKYERGTNSVEPAKLVALARILDVPVGYFFKEPDEMEKGSGIDAGLLRLISRLVLIQRERPEALAVVQDIVRVVCNEIQGVRPVPRPHRRKKAAQKLNTAGAKRARQSI